MKVKNDKLIKLYHYFDTTTPLFKVLTELNREEGINLLKNQKPVLKNIPHASNRPTEYYDNRLKCEEKLKEVISKKDCFRIERKYPVYASLGECKLMKYFHTGNANFWCDVRELDLSAISFTYGDSFYALFNARNFKESEYEWLYKVYTYDEIIELVNRIGYPHIDEYEGGFIEAQIWADDVLESMVKYAEEHNTIRQILVPGKRRFL